MGDGGVSRGRSVAVAVGGSDMWHVTGRHAKCHFLYTIQILGRQFLPQKFVILGNTKFPPKQKKQKKRLKIIKIHYKFSKNCLTVIFPTFPRACIPKKFKIVTKKLFTAKHRMCSNKLNPNPENLTPSRMVWMMTFCKSGEKWRTTTDTCHLTRYIYKKNCIGATIWRFDVSHFHTFDCNSG